MATGPLRAAQPRRGGSWLISFALFGIAVGAIAVTVSGLSARRGEALAQPTTSTPIAMRPIPARSPLPSAPSAEPARETRIERAAAPEFKLDALPVLQIDGLDADLEAAPARQSGKSPSRRAAAATPR